MDPRQLPLRDIHLPPPVAWWPPAPGWWLLLAATLLLATTVAWIQRRRSGLRGRALRRLATLQAEYERQPAPELLSRRLSVLLRRVCLSYHPRPEVAGLAGESWLEFLEKRLGDGRFTSGPGRALAVAPYRRQAQIDAEALLRLCSDWLRALPARPKRPAKPGKRRMR